MKLHTLMLSAALGAALPTMAQTAAPPPTEPASPAGLPANTRPAPTGSDQSFLDTAHASGTQEIKWARLAQERAQDADLKSLAAMIERDHRDLNAKLAAAGAKADARPHDMPAPAGSAADTGLPAAGEAAADADAAHAGHEDDAQLREAKGAAFDQAYLAMLVSKHGESIAKFEAAASGDGYSTEVSALARQALPGLRRHADMAASLKKQSPAR